MDRRQFVSRASLGFAAACTGLPKLTAAATTATELRVRFVGMMGFIERDDRSFLVATPGQHGLHHMTHVPFLMARAGSGIATALRMKPAPGVVPEAFDTSLIDTRANDFVYRSLDNTSLEITSGTVDAVTNNATEMAMMNRIAPGQRLRGNLEKWASSTVSLRGGRLENSEAHPDAHRVWTFGNYSQRLTDAVNFKNDGAPTSIRLTSTTEVHSYKSTPSEAAELWVISAATPDARGGNPTRLEHSQLLFEYVVDGKPILAECPDATGREVPETELPYMKPTSASLGTIAAETRFPPFTEMCYLAAWLLGTSGGN